MARTKGGTLVYFSKIVRKPRVMTLGRETYGWELDWMRKPYVAAVERDVLMPNGLRTQVAYTTDQQGHLIHALIADTVCDLACRH